MNIIIKTNPELKEIVRKVRSRIKGDYQIFENQIKNPDFYIDLDINYEVNIIKLVFSTRNQKCRQSFEDNMGNLRWRTEIINYSYLMTEEYPTVGLEIYNRSLEEQDVTDIANLIINSIYDYYKKGK